MSKTFGPTVVDNVTPVAFTTKTAAKKVIIYENGQIATADYLVRAPASTDSETTKAAGKEIQFSPQNGSLQFAIGETICFIRSAGAAMNLYQQED